jgi:hypothetical protein
LLMMNISPIPSPRIWKPRFGERNRPGGKSHPRFGAVHFEFPSAQPFSAELTDEITHLHLELQKEQELALQLDEDVKRAHHQFTLNRETISRLCTAYFPKINCYCSHWADICRHYFFILCTYDSRI